jgi:hypothetical protein
MVTKKQAEFNSIMAANIWVEVNRKVIHVLGLSEVLDDWGYPTSSRLKRPKVILQYLDFRE